MPARFAGYFPPMLRFEPLEIHKVFLRASNLALAKNLSPDLLVKSHGEPFNFRVYSTKSADYLQ